jgi:hemoglobin
MKVAHARWSLLCLLLAGTAFAQDKVDQAIQRQDLDARINRQLYLATVAGVTAFNAPRNDPAGCAGIFQGALIAVEGLLDHRPESKALIDRELKRADAQTNPVDKAKTLRKAIDYVRGAIEKDQKELLTKLWNRLGGQRTVRVLVKEFVERAAKDEKVDLTRGGQFPLNAENTPKLEQTLVEFFSVTTGGDLPSKLKDVKAAHAELGITEEQTGPLGGHLIEVLKKRNLPQKDIDEVIAAVGFKKEVAAATPMATPKGPELVKAAPKPLSLWKELGGKDAVRAVVKDFMAIALKDEKVDFTRGGKFKLDDDAVAKLEQAIVDYLSSVTGGALPYNGKDMKAAHAGMKITDAQFTACADDLVLALKKHNVEQETIDALMKVVATTKELIVEQE